MFFQHLIDIFSCTCIFFQKNNRIIGQLMQINHMIFQLGIAVRRHKDILYLTHDLDVHCLIFCKWLRYNTEINLAFFQIHQCLRGRAVRDMYFDRRVFLVKQIQIRKQVKLQCHIGSTDPDLTRFQIFQFGKHLFPLLHFFISLFDIGKQYFSLRGQADPSGTSDDQLCIQCFFKLAH